MDDALAYSCDTCVGSESQEMKNLVKNLSDAMSWNLKVVQEISLERRSSILSSLNINKKYRNLDRNAGDRFRFGKRSEGNPEFNRLDLKTRIELCPVK